MTIDKKTKHDRMKKISLTQKISKMKQKLPVCLITIALLSLSFFSCRTKSPIWDTEPMDITYTTNFPLDQFHKLGMANDTLGQKKMVDQYRKQLTRNIMSHYPCVTNEKNIRFILGSGYVKKVLSGDGKTYNGQFKNELIIIVNDSCVKDTVFLACGNGMLSPIRWNKYSDWGSVEKCRFIVQEGQSLAYFLPSLEDWGIQAQEIGLPILDKKGKYTSSKVYLNYLGEWWSGYLFPGDIIDLCKGIITDKNGHEIDFTRRAIGTKKYRQNYLDQKINYLKNHLNFLVKRKRSRKNRNEMNKIKSEITFLQAQKKTL